MNKSQAPLLFPITIFQELGTNGIITKARARIFYKYRNRNGGYITDTFADLLLETLPGSPVKGIYNEDKGDYTDHGSSRTQGRAYGFVPETNHNIAYEVHLDEDGIERTYACADVYLWTSLYDEAIDILGSAQSMELYEPSVKGSWKNIEGQRMFEYTEGSFLGLQVLGKDTEPCFEGAAFFSLLEDFPQDFLQSLYDSFLKFQLQIQKGGKDMNEKLELAFKLSDSQKANKIFQALNAENWVYYVHEVYDTYAIVFNFETEEFGKILYEKDDEAETVTLLGEVEVVFAEFLTEGERETLNVLRQLRTTYEAATEDFEILQTDLEEAAQKIEERDMTISTLTQEREVSQETLVEKEQLIEELQTKVESLVTYKENVELAEKTAVIEQYVGKLDDVILDNYKENISEFSHLELAKELAFELVQTNSTMFSQNPIARTPKDKEETGINAILDRYKKN